MEENKIKIAGVITLHNTTLKIINNINLILTIWIFYLLLRI